MAALDRYAATPGAGPLTALKSETPGERVLRAFLGAALDLVHEGGSVRGCFAACVAAGAAGDDEVIRNRLNAILRAHEAPLGEAAGERGPAGGLSLGAMQAVAVRARAGATRDELDRLARDLGDRLLGRG